MIRTFEELFEKMEADGRKRSMLQIMYRKLQKYRAAGNPDIIFDDTELRKMLHRSSWISGYLDCLREEGYISPKEYAKLLYDTLLVR